MNQYKNKRVTVVGMARSGIAAATLLKKLGAKVAVTETKSATGQLDIAKRRLQEEGIEVELSGHSREFLQESSLVVVSPGVPQDSKPVVWAQELGIEVIGELELASSLCPAPIIAVTGTNGKTTTTALIAELIRASGSTVHVLGNIGRPFCQCVLDINRSDYVSLEVSSFQLENIKDFHPKIAVILNLTADHLDRHKTLREYLQIKKRIFLNQNKGDYLVLNYADELLRGLAAEAKSKVIFFNKGDGVTGFDENQLAALEVAKVLKIDRDTCMDVLKHFKGVEHRLEFVRTLGGVDFVNDSKATNISSGVWALNNTDKPTILIAGGRDKDSDFGLIGDLVKKKVKFAVLVGEASTRIARSWQGILPLQQVKTFKEAVVVAWGKAQPGDCVLLSPMAKSFDMFTDFEHRGRVFKELVASLK